MSTPKRRRKLIQTTISDTTRASLDAMIAAGIYSTLAEALDAAVARLRVYHQRRQELPPEPPDPGEDDNSAPPLT